jgi:hypothetical protein
MTGEEFAWLRRELLMPEVELLVRMMARAASSPEEKKRVLDHPWVGVQELDLSTPDFYQEKFRGFAGHILLSRYIMLDYCRGNRFGLTRSQRRHFRKLSIIHWSRAKKVHRKMSLVFMLEPEDIWHDDQVFWDLCTLLGKQLANSEKER